MIIVVSCFWLYSKVFHFWETCRLPSFFTRHLQAPKNNLDCPPPADHHRPVHDAHSRSPADDRRPDPYRLSKGKPMKDTENRPQPRKRRKWGSVIVRRDADGNPTSFQARYVNPLDPPKKVGRNFGLEYETEAYRWLDEERYLVTLHNKGIRQWVHPSQRGANTMPTFREYSKDYFDKYHKPDGSKLSGRSNRCNGIVLRRLNETFGDTPLDRITRQMVDEWYAR